LSENKESPTWKYSEPKEGIPEYYANHVSVFWSGVDLTLILGELTHSSENLARNILEIENRVKITVPWPVAKLIATNLAEVIARYEQKNGELKLPGAYQLP
jgi:hypothetical protein